MKVLPLLLATLAWEIPTMAGDWPHWRGPRHNGISPETVPRELPETLPIVWTTNVGTGFCTVSVVGDRVLTMGNREDRETVWCLDANTGQPLWEHTYDCSLDPLYYEGGPGATPAIHDGAVYTLSKKGHVFRLDLETGTVVWNRDLVADHGFELPEWSFAGSPLVDGNRLLLNVGRGGIALDLASGTTIWKGGTETAGYATPVPFVHQSTGTTHLLFSAEALLGIDSNSGRQTWKHLWKSSRDVNAADPVAVGDRVVLSSSDGSALLDLSPGHPEVVWEQPDMKWYFNPGVLVDGHLYSLHGTTHRPTELMCVDAATGKIVWTEPGFGSGGLVAAGEIVILFDQGELTLFSASPEGYRPLLRQKILEGKCWTSPVISRGRIYCRNADGDIACLRIPSQSE